MLIRKSEGRNMSKNAFFCIICLCCLYPAFSQSSFSRGEAAFMANRPQEAITHLEAAIREDPAHVQAFLYLGISYLQLDRRDDAISIYQRILPRAGAETARIAFNLGNVYFLNRDHVLAIESYSQALNANPLFSTALLNMANAKVAMGRYNEAIEDYERYLMLEPGSSQSSQIRRLINFIRDEAAAMERRVQEERAAEEQRRLIAEQNQRLEAERRQQLLADISASLQAAAEDLTSLSAGNEGIQGYEGQFELE